MDNFSKFLLDKEELKLVIKPRLNNFRVYFIYTAIVLAFFLLYPMFSWGRHGVFFWLFLIIYLFILLAQAYLSRLNFYLFTNKRIVYVKAVNKEKFIFKGAIFLKNIHKIKRSGKRDLCIIADEKKFYLQNIKDRDQIYKKIQNMV